MRCIVTLHPATTWARVRRPVRSADGRCPGDHDVPRDVARAAPSPVASTSSTNVTASHGFQRRGDRVDQPATAADAPASHPGRSTPTPRSPTPQTNRVDRLAGDERVAEQRRGDGQPGAPEHEHHRARPASGSSSHGARMSSCAPSYHLRPALPAPVAGRGGRQRAAAEQPDEQQEGDRAVPGVRRHDAAAQQRADREQRSRAGPARRAAAGPAGRDAAAAAEALGGPARGRSGAR